jgi:retron-type reverse transcriptase
LEKAFDRVWIKGLLYKMHQAGLNINFIKLMSSYLTNRRIKVKVNNEISNEKLINAGVPQGSVLGPTLFNLFIHDMPQFAKTNLALYADDTAIYAHSFFAQAALLQNRLHLKILSTYFDKSKLKLNETTTETIIFSRKRTNNKIFTK